MPRPLRFFGLLILHLIVALVGTAILEHTIWKVIPSHSVMAVLWKEWTLSITIAASIGFLTRCKWQDEAAKWTWLLPALWFGLRWIVALGSGGAWSQLSGSGCANGSQVECSNFFVFTIPFIRGTSYSLGVYVCSLIQRAQGPSASIAPPSTSP